MTERRVIVTGAAGFIGFHLTRRLLDDGATVLGLDNLNSYYDPALKRARLAQIQGRNGFAFAEADIADGDRVTALFEEFRPTEVVNLAAQAGVRYSLTHPRAYVAPTSTAFSPSSRPAAPTPSATSSMPRRAPFTAPTARCRSRRPIGWTGRCRSTRRRSARTS